jgi:adenylate cyclase
MLPAVSGQPDDVAASVERQLWGEPELTAEQIAEETGVPVESLVEWHRALGVSTVAPDTVAFDRGDLEAARRLKALFDAGVPEETLHDVIRVLGVGMGRFAEAVRDMWVQTFAGEDPDDDAAQRLGEMGQQFLPVGTELIAYTFSLHLREILRHDTTGLAARAPGGGRMVDVAVGFADIVGYSELGEQLSSDEMARVADRLTDKAHRVAEPPVRIVKTLGDGVMLASSEIEPLLHVLLDLAETPGDDPPVRGGLAFGPALHRMGDYYGHTVNVASRVAQRARPGAVLATQEVRERSDDGFDWSSAGPKRLKGVGTLETFRCRRGAPRP